MTTRRRPPPHGPQRTRCRPQHRCTIGAGLWKTHAEFVESIPRRAERQGRVGTVPEILPAPSMARRERTGGPSLRVERDVRGPRRVWSRTAAPGEQSRAHIPAPTSRSGTGAPCALGMERPLGKGSVGIPRFVATLREIGFQGPLNVERETENHDERLRDIGEGIALLRSLSK